MCKFARFRVRRERDPRVFGQRSHRVFTQPHSVNDELRWLEAEGANHPTLIDYPCKKRRTIRLLSFFSYRYYHAFPRRARHRPACHSRSDCRTRRRDWPDDLPVDIQRCPRPHSTLP